MGDYTIYLLCDFNFSFKVSITETNVILVLKLLYVVLCIFSTLKPPTVKLEEFTVVNKSLS